MICSLHTEGKYTFMQRFLSSQVFEGTIITQYFIILTLLTSKV